MAGNLSKDEIGITQNDTHKSGVACIKKYLIFYLGISLFLSTTIILRLVVTTFDHAPLSLFKVIGFCNVVFYDLYYYIMPVIAIMLLFRSTDRSSEKSSTWMRLSIDILVPTLIVFSIFLLLLTDFYINNVIFYVISPLLVVSILYFKFWKKESLTFPKKTILYYVK